MNRLDYTWQTTEHMKVVKDGKENDVAIVLCFKTKKERDLFEKTNKVMSVIVAGGSL